MNTKSCFSQISARHWKYRPIRKVPEVWGHRNPTSGEGIAQAAGLQTLGNPIPISETLFPNNGIKHHHQPKTGIKRTGNGRSSIQMICLPGDNLNHLMRPKKSQRAPLVNWPGTRKNIKQSISLFSLHANLTWIQVFFSNSIFSFPHQQTSWVHYISVSSFLPHALPDFLP